jgi:hypothetical protein
MKLNVDLIRGSSIKAELSVPILGMVSLLTACFIVCAKKYFLDDELISFILVTDPSQFHMLRALADQVDVSPPFYYVLAWLWARVFGASEISLRIISSLGMGLAFFITWRVIRPTFGLWATSLGITGAFFLSLLVLEHNAEARFYGLFMAIGALALLQYGRFNRNGLACSWKDFFSNMGIHGSLVLTHNFGLLYSGIFLLAYILTGTYKRVFASKVYLSVILGWLAFWPWLVPFFFHQAEVGNPHSWIPVPGYRELLLSFSHGIMITLFIPVIILLSWFMSINAAYSKDNVSKFGLSPSSFPLLILGFLLVVLPPIPTWIISRTVISVFADKYMILSTLGWSILLSWLIWRALPPLKNLSQGTLGVLYFSAITKKRC